MIKVLRIPIKNSSYIINNAKIIFHRNSTSMNKLLTSIEIISILSYKNTSSILHKTTPRPLTPHPSQMNPISLQYYLKKRTTNLQKVRIKIHECYFLKVQGTQIRHRNDMWGVAGINVKLWFFRRVKMK